MPQDKTKYYTRVKTVPPSNFQYDNDEVITYSILETYLDKKLDKEGGTLTGPLYLARDPQTSLEAATKQYVDSISRNAINISFEPYRDITATNVQEAIEQLESMKVSKSGDTMIGRLFTIVEPIYDNEVVPKKYVDQYRSECYSIIEDNFVYDNQIGEYVYTIYYTLERLPSIQIFDKNGHPLLVPFYLDHDIRRLCIYSIRPFEGYIVLTL